MLFNSNENFLTKLAYHGDGTYSLEKTLAIPFWSNLIIIWIMYVYIYIFVCVFLLSTTELFRFFDDDSYCSVDLSLVNFVFCLIGKNKISIYLSIYLSILDYPKEVRSGRVLAKETGGQQNGKWTSQLLANRWRHPYHIGEDPWGQGTLPSMLLSTPETDKLISMCL